MLLERIEALLKERMGLDASSIGAASLERAVRERLISSRMEDMSLYWQHLSRSEVELQELIEAVVVPETWFFRDREAFTALTRFAQEWLATHSQGTLKLLSLPCSTGEEPYSMAMSLLQAGFAPQQLSIDAVDISARALTHARRAVYGKNAFRAKDLGFRDSYFEVQTPESAWRLRESVRQLVRFHQGNLVTREGLPTGQVYDVIFCRNVLIYFDRATQERSLDLLSQLLAPRGYIFVGPSESALLMDRGFASANRPRAFAFHKSAAVSSVRGTPLRLPTAKAVVSVQIPIRKPKPAASVALKKVSHFPVTAPPAPAATAVSGVPAWVEQARQMADRGELTQALQLGEQQLRTEQCAEGFYLLGVLHDAMGQARKAAEHYRKALYLEPQHHEALVHLAVVLTAQGDAQGAERLLKRAKRSASVGSDT